MENQHKLINGYRDLTEFEIRIMNSIKEEGATLEELINSVSLVLLTATEFSSDAEKEEALMWHHEARKAFKKGLMYLTRSVARPQSF